MPISKKTCEKRLSKSKKSRKKKTVLEVSTMSLEELENSIQDGMKKYSYAEMLQLKKQHQIIRDTQIGPIREITEKNSSLIASLQSILNIGQRIMITPSGVYIQSDIFCDKVKKFEETEPRIGEYVSK